MHRRLRSLVDLTALVIGGAAALIACASDSVQTNDGPADAASSVLGASVVGVTATQAIVSYVAPDDAPCTFLLAQDPPNAAPVPDADPAIFAAANVDSREGSLANGRQRALVLGKRAAELGLDGKRHSRALEADAAHAITITCGGLAQTVTFRTGNIPLGNTHADPLPVDPKSPGDYAWPTLDANDPTHGFVDPQTGIFLKPYASLSGIPPADGSGGNCSTIPVSMPNGDRGTVCMSQSTLWFINAKTGDVVSLGTVHVTPFNQDCSPDGIFDRNGSNRLFCAAAVAATDAYANTDTRIVEVQYRGDSSSFNGPLPDCSLGKQPCVSFTVRTPTKTLQQLIRDVAPNAHPTYCAIGPMKADDAISFVCTESGQDSYGWVGLLDLSQPKVTALLSSYESAAPARWCALHGPTLRIDGWMGMVTNSLLGPTTTDGMGPYVMHVTGGALDKTVVDCPANTLGVTGKQCSTVAVDHEPLKPSGSARDPAYLQDIEVGDFVGIELGSYTQQEWMRLVAKNGLNWTFQRAWNLWGGPLGANYGSPWFDDYLRDHSSSDKTLYALCGASATKGIFHWDYQSDPLAARSSSIVLEVTAAAHRTDSQSFIISPTYEVREGPVPALWLQAKPTYTINGNPPFADIAGIGLPNAVDTHPNGVVDGKWFLDGRPLNNGYSGGKPGDPTLDADKRGDRLYHLTSNAYGGYAGAKATHVTVNPEIDSVFAYCGSHVLQDVSGSDSVIDDSAANAYRYCIARRPHECDPSSVVGDIFVNCPGVTVPHCQADGAQVDICIGDTGAFTSGIVQVGVGRADGAGAFSRLLTHGLEVYHRESVYLNAEAIPNTSWFTLAIPGGQAVSATQSFYLGKLPPFPSPDGVDRSSFLPLSIDVPAVSGASEVIVRFGYAEHGDVADYRCTSRREACVEDARKDAPFSYESDAAQGVACAAGCKVVLPVLPERVVYFEIVYRDSAGAVVRRRAMSAAAGAPPFAAWSPPDGP